MLQRDCGQVQCQDLSPTFLQSGHKPRESLPDPVYLQLYHGADEYGVAGSWLSDALNTNIHTFEVNKGGIESISTVHVQVAPAFIIIEHSVLGHIRRLFGWGDQVEKGRCSSQQLIIHTLTDSSIL